MLKQHADKRSLFGCPEGLNSLAVEENFAGIRSVKADEGLEQHRLTGSRSSGDANDFARLDIEVDSVVNHLRTESVDDASRGNYRLGIRRGLNIHMPSLSNRMENNASRARTTKIALTTALVVSRPTLSAEPLTRSPCMQPMTAMKNAKIGP